MKGQTSMEFFLMFGLSMAALSIMFGAISQKQGQVYEMHNRDMASEVASNIGFQSEMALVQGPGYSRAFSLPGNIAGRPYNVTVVNTSVYISYGDSKFVTEQTLYQGKEINFSTNETNTFKILHNSSGVFVVEE